MHPRSQAAGQAATKTCRFWKIRRHCWSLRLLTWVRRIFVTEKDGLIRVIQDDLLLDSPLATFRTADVFDGGLLGIALHPNFVNNHYIYVFLTYQEDGTLWNKILRIIESENKLQDAKTIFDKIPGSTFTNGGFIKFGPDRKLYVGNIP